MSLDMAFQNPGRFLAASWGGTVVSIHLYNASRKSGLNKEVWEDMEFLISVHGEDYLFYGGAPKKPMDLMKKFYMSMGNSLENMVPNRHNKNVVRSVQRKRTNVESAAQTLTYPFVESDVRDKHARNARTRFTLGDVEMIVEKAMAPSNCPPPTHLRSTACLRWWSEKDSSEQRSQQTFTTTVPGCALRSYQQRANDTCL